MCKSTAEEGTESGSMTLRDCIYACTYPHVHTYIHTHTHIFSQTELLAGKFNVAECLYASAVTHYSRGHYNEAREMVDRLLRMSPDHRYGTELHVYLKDAQGLYIYTHTRTRIYIFVCVCVCV